MSMLPASWRRTLASWLVRIAGRIDPPPGMTLAQAQAYKTVMTRRLLGTLPEAGVRCPECKAVIDIRWLA